MKDWWQETELRNWEPRLRDTVEYTRAIRRKVHAHPELSGHEKVTSSMVEEEARKSGAEVHRFEGCEGVMAEIRNGEGRCVAVRADMDALPIQEDTGLEFASRCPGVMHACGHDVHTSLALGSMRWMSEHKDLWHGTVRYLFEPQEETVGGGKFMAAQGCMEGVDCVFGQHVNPRYPAGTWFCKPGYVSGSSDEIHLVIRGKSCHGAYPESGVDAIVIAASVITALQTMVSRVLSPFDPCALTLGKIEGGQARNIVCGEVQIEGTLRTLTDATRGTLKEKIRTLAESIAMGMGGTAEVTFTPGYGAVRNDDHYYRLLESVARDILGDARMVERAQPSLGVESFCYFVEHTPGVYYDIGSGISTALHTPTFCVDEDVLLPGLALQCAGMLAILGEEGKA